MIWAVLDTNVLISSLLNRDNPPAAIVRRWRDHREYEVVVTTTLLSEYAHVLRYAHLRQVHRYTDEEIDEWVGGVREAAIVVIPARLPPTILADLDDDALLAAAVSGSASHIVSGDKHLHALGAFQGIEIVTPARFLRVLERGG